MKSFFVSLLFISNSCLSQELKLIPLTLTETNRKVEYHYQYESQNSHVGSIDLLLLKNGSYEYQIASNVYNAFSIGHWKISKDILTLNSDIQSNDLPIKLIYRAKEDNESDIKKIAFIKDLKGSIIDYALVYINNDSLSCMDGDLICTGKFEKIDSIKVRFENHGISSTWIPVKPFNGILQIIIQTNKNLRNYIVFNNETYKVLTNSLAKPKN